VSHPLAGYDIFLIQLPRMFSANPPPFGVGALFGEFPPPRLSPPSFFLLPYLRALFVIPIFPSRLPWASPHLPFLFPHMLGYTFAPPPNVDVSSIRLPVLPPPLTAPCPPQRVTGETPPTPPQYGFDVAVVLLAEATLHSECYFLCQFLSARFFPLLPLGTWFSG